MRRKTIEILAIIAVIAAFSALTILAGDDGRSAPDPDQSQERIAAWQREHAKTEVAASR